MKVVDSISQYKMIVLHAPNFLRGILSLKTGAWILCQLLHDKMFISKCDCCGGIGGYLYLLTCKRVCFICYQERQPLFFPLTCSEADSKYGIRIGHDVDWDSYTAIPHMKVPESFGIMYQEHSCTRYLDHESVRRESLEMRAPELEGTTWLLQSPKITRFKDLHKTERWMSRYLANIRAPW